MLNAKSILSLSIFIIFKLIYTVSTFSRTRQGNISVKIKKRVKERKTSGNIWQKEEKVVTLHPVKCKGYNGHAPKGHEMMRRTSP